MSKSKSYPEEIFEQRLKRYKVTRRSQLPHQVEMSTCQRVNSRVMAGAAYPGHFLYVRKGTAHTGALLPVNLFDARIRYDEVTGNAVMEGRSGPLVLDETICMVDAVRFFLEALKQESCGECTSCRIGTLRMLEIHNRICAGGGTPRDIDALEDLAVQVASASMCQVGKSAAAVVNDSLRLFRSQYTDHVLERRCPSNTCNITHAGNGSL